MKPEEEARKKIDGLLELACWKLQDYKGLSLGAGSGVAVRALTVLKAPLSALLSPI